jgi:hypothetical protein
MVRAMPPEILALIDHPLSLMAVLFVGALAGMSVEQFVVRQRRAAWRRRKPAKWQQGGGRVLPSGARNSAVTAKAADAADQLRTVMAADFKRQVLLNRSEARLLTALDRIVAELAPGWRVMAQVSLGEVLASADAAAYACINSKRVHRSREHRPPDDALSRIVLVDADCTPLHAIEYQGSGHHQGTAAARDAVKKSPRAACPGDRRAR